MIQARNGQSQSEPKTRGRFTGQRLKLLRPETYRQAVELLAEPREQVPYSIVFLRLNYVACFIVNPNHSIM
jgi:broad specificity phosphatase PhoE